MPVVSLAFQWLLSALSMTAISKFLPGFRLNGFGAALIVAALYGGLHVVFYKID